MVLGPFENLTNLEPDPLFLVVEADELYFGFDLRKAAEFDIAVNIVTQSIPGVGINGKIVDGIVVG